MRKLHRNKVAVPKILADPTGAGFEETAKAIAYFKKKAVTEKFIYGVYRNSEIKDLLCILSHNKCAYCEINAVSGNDGDVEHFRPKGEVTVKDTATGKVVKKPGYFWLGAKWENLYLSCSHCNQSRIQPTIEGTRLTMGKKNQFPLSDYTKRLKSPDHQIAHEEPYRLLIDPCCDDPLEHLRFDEDGIVSPQILKGKKESEKGKHSIEVFALLRKKLVEDRKCHAIAVKAMLSSYELNLKNYSKSNQGLSKTEIAEKESDIMAATKALKAFYHPAQRFSAMSFQLIQSFMAKKDVHITDIDK